MSSIFHVLDEYGKRWRQMCKYINFLKALIHGQVLCMQVNAKSMMHTAFKLAQWTRLRKKLSPNLYLFILLTCTPAHTLSVEMRTFCTPTFFENDICIFEMLRLRRIHWYQNRHVKSIFMDFQ